MGEEAGKTNGRTLLGVGMVATQGAYTTLQE